MPQYQLVRSDPESDPGNTRQCSPARPDFGAHGILSVFHSRYVPSSTGPATATNPGFNMPFELGLAVGYHTRRANREHIWFVFETRPWRLQKSLSDLNGTGVYAHSGTPAGVFYELLSAFVRHHNQPTVRQMTVIFEALRKNLRPVLQRPAPLRRSRRAFSGGSACTLAPWRMSS